MPVHRLKEFLEENEIKFVTISHSQAFTAQQIAAAAHVPGKEMAKAVMVKLDGELAMVVLPATHQVSIPRLKEATGAGEVELASDVSSRTVFPIARSGRCPPFGNLWVLTVFVEERFRADGQIAFNAASHTELVKLSYAHYERLVDPVVARLSTRS